MSNVLASAKRAVQGMTRDDKSAQLLHNTVDPTEPASGTHITTMHGQRVSDTDNWLKAADPQHGGPFLLEGSSSVVLPLVYAHAP